MLGIKVVNHFYPQLINVFHSKSGKIEMNDHKIPVSAKDVNPSTLLVPTKWNT